MSLRPQSARRRNSYIEVEANPLEQAIQPGGVATGVKFESLAEALPISQSDCADLIANLKSQR